MEWLAGLEKAIKFSLASRLSDCLATLPPALSGQPLTSGGVEEVVEWLGGNVEQNVLLTLDIHWSHRLLKALTDTPTIQAIWFVPLSSVSLKRLALLQLTAEESSGELSPATAEVLQTSAGRGTEFSSNSTPPEKHHHLPEEKNRFCRFSSDG